MSGESRREHNPIHSSSKRALKKADRLAPPEERATKSANGNSKGVIALDTGELALPKDLVETNEGKWSFLGLDPLALIILLFSLAFIIFIARLISTESAETKDEARPAVESRP
ncbi:MAG TPA: hypothetical protein VJT09_01275 [Pyrinomonadaceae bacterium]|nr:hypothetical protein [Pyrinomonadaceae bacterium]